MSYRDSCGLCGESYDDENLETCGECHRSFCYHCGSFGEKRCQQCSEADQAAAAPPAPMRFSERTTFWDVEGIPVTLGGGEGVPYSAAWDGEVPRPFPPESVHRNGAEISLDAFNALVASFRAGHQQQHGSNETMPKPDEGTDKPLTR